MLVLCEGMTAPAAEPAMLVERPQHALLLRDSGGGTRIWVDALTPQRLTYRACDTANEKYKTCSEAWSAACRCSASRP